MAGSIYSEAQRAVATAFASTRRNLGVNQTELAHRIGKHQSYISDIERGQRRIDILEAYVIARALGIEPTEFYQTLISGISVEVEI